MALFGPAIPTAVLLSPEGPSEVHPASESWWQNIITLREASQQDRLRCPDCGQRLVFVCEGVPTPHFKHYRDTEGCNESAERDPERHAKRANAWFRHQLVVAFRRVLPEGTAFDCGQYLANRSSEIRVTLPGGKEFTLEVVAQPPDMAQLAARQQPHRVTVFVGKRVPAAVARAGLGGPTPVRIADGLNADHLAAAMPYRVDIAHAARHAFYNLASLDGEPSTLLFFLPGRTQTEPGTLAILRGLMPNPDVTCWHGTVIKTRLVEGAHVRFSLRHGFHTGEDTAVLTYYRKRQRLQRIHDFPGAHPVDRLWLRRKAELDRIRRLEQERIAAERQRAESFAAAERLYGALLSVLRHEGLDLLQGRALPVPRPELYAVPPIDWQARLLGFVQRAGLVFTVGAAASWLRYRGYVRQYNELAELRNQQAFWQAADRVGLVRYESDERIVPLRPFAWPVAEAGVGEKGLCIICATVHADRDLHLTDEWRVHDPVHGLCICLDCPV